MEPNDVRLTLRGDRSMDAWLVRTGLPGDDYGHWLRHRLQLAATAAAANDNDNDDDDDDDDDDGGGADGVTNDESANDDGEVREGKRKKRKPAPWEKEIDSDSLPALEKAHGMALAEIELARTPAG